MNFKKTDGNHIFLNFVPTVTMHPFNIAKDIEEKILKRYAHRLMKLKVKYAEISITSRYVKEVKFENIVFLKHKLRFLAQQKARNGLFKPTPGSWFSPPGQPN